MVKLYLSFHKKILWQSIKEILAIIPKKSIDVYYLHMCCFFNWVSIIIFYCQSCSKSAPLWYVCWLLLFWNLDPLFFFNGDSKRKDTKQTPLRPLLTWWVSVNTPAFYWGATSLKQLGSPRLFLFFEAFEYFFVSIQNTLNPNTQKYI